MMNTSAPVRKWQLQATPILVALLSVLQSVPADACRGHRYWSIGTDISKLKSGEIAIRAKLIESFKGDRVRDSIMGMPYAMLYRVQVTEVLGSDADAKVSFTADAHLFVLQAASICERFVPRNFGKDVEKVLVVKEGTAGVLELVGGQE
jgi:hypothetical protein